MQLGAKTEARLGRIIDVFYYLLILVGFYLFMRYAFWLAFPFMFAFMVAMVLQRPVNYAHRKIKLKKSFSAVSLVLLFYVLIVIVIGLIGMRIWSAAKSFGGFLSGQINNLPEIIKELQLRINQLVTWLPDAMETKINTSLGAFVDSLLSGVGTDGTTTSTFGSLLSHINLDWFKAPMNGVLSAAGKIPTVVVTAIITVIASFFVTLGYDKIVGFLKRQLNPERRSALSAAKRILFSSLGKLLRSYSILLSVTFVEILLGLGLLTLIGVFDGKYLFWIALVTAIVDIFPVLGTGTILVPWALYHLIMGNLGMGIGLLILLAVITVVRQVLEPKILSANLGLPPIVTLMGMFIGLQLFGFFGMLLVPLLLTLLKLLNDEGVIHIWKKAP